MKKYLIFLFALVLVTFKIQAQDFQTFIKNFKVTTLPFVADKAVLEGCKQGQLKAIPMEEIKKFILQTPMDSLHINSYWLFTNFEENELEKHLKNNLVQFYYFKKLFLSKDFESVLIYYVNQVDKNGLREWKIVLLNYTPEGKLVNSFTFADEEIFMSYRIYTATLDANLNITRVERDFEAKNTKALGNPTYEVDYHFAIQKNDMSIISTQQKFYPYLGEYRSDKEVLSIDQNKNHFYVMRGNINAGVYKGMKVKSYNLNEGAFVLETDEKETWIGKFNADKSHITITKPDKSTVLFERK